MKDGTKTFYDRPVTHQSTRGSELLHGNELAHPTMPNEDADNWFRRDYIK